MSTRIKSSCHCMVWLLGLAVGLLPGCDTPKGAQTTQKNGAAWKAALLSRIQDADSLEIVIRAGCEDSTVVAKGQIEGREAIAELLALIEIEHYNGEYAFLCSGQDTIAFSKNKQPLVTLTRTPLTGLTWKHPDWPGDAIMKMESYRKITQWLEKRGFDYLAQELITVEKRSRNARLAEEELVSDFPAEVRQILLRSNRSDGEIDAQQAVQRNGTPVEGFQAICRCLGRIKTEESSWTMTIPLTRAVLDLAHNTDSAYFWQAVRGLADDPRGLSGAARLFFREGIGAKTVQQVDGSLIQKMASQVLTNGFDQNKPTIIRFFRDSREQIARELLVLIATGAVGTEIDHANAWDEEPGIRFMALLALVQNGETVPPDLWNRLSDSAEIAQDRAAIEVAGCLLGKKHKIVMRHFEFKSYLLGEAAISALRRAPGPISIGLLADGGINHPWAAIREEAEIALQEMIGQSWKPEERRRKIEEWLGAHSKMWIRPEERDQAD